MKNKGEIRWLQLSDLHMFDSTTMRRQKEKLFERFKETIDFIIITGDLHQYGKSYSLTLSFLNELVSEMGIGKKDIIIVPGNHDVSASDRRAENLKYIEKEIESNEDAYYDVLSELHSDFAKYVKFLSAFYGSDTDFDFLNNYIYIWDNKIALLCLNTALASDGNHDKKQIVDIRGLNELKNNHYPCIALMHHNYYAITDAQRPFVNTKFEELGVSAVLSGHEHKSSKNTIELENSVFIPNYCSGKSFSEPGDLWSDIEIIEYRWKLTEKETKIITYSWNQRNLSFMPSTKFENHGHILDGKILLEQGFTWRKFFPEILPLADSDTPSKVLPATEPPLSSAKTKSFFIKFKNQLQLLAVSTILSLILAAIAWYADYSAGSSIQQLQLSYAETLDGNLIVFENKKTMHEAQLQAVGQVIVTVKDKPVETYIIDGMYRETTSINNSKKIILKEYDCPLADSCVKKLEEELKSGLPAHAEEDIRVKEVAFMYVSACTESPGERISGYYIFEDGALIYLDNEAAESKMHGVIITSENWNLPEHQEKILADTKNHVLDYLREPPSDY